MKCWVVKLLARVKASDANWKETIAALDVAGAMKVKVKLCIGFGRKKQNHLPTQTALRTFIRYERKIQYELESSLRHKKETINMLYYVQTTSRENHPEQKIQTKPQSV